MSKSRTKRVKKQPEPQWTKGDEWIQSAGIVYSFGEDGGIICELSEPRDYGSTDVEHHKVKISSKDFREAIANGYLIAAAPDLYAALTAILEGDGFMVAEAGHATLDAARAALAKARGERPAERPPLASAHTES